MLLHVFNFLILFCRPNSSSKWALSSPSWGWWVWKWPLGGDRVNGPRKRESCLKAEMAPCSVAKQNLCSQLLKVTISFCFPTSLPLGRAWNCKGSSEAQPSCGCPDLVAKARARTYCVILWIAVPAPSVNNVQSWRICDFCLGWFFTEGQ